MLAHLYCKHLKSSDALANLRHIYSPRLGEINFFLNGQSARSQKLLDRFSICFHHSKAYLISIAVSVDHFDERHDRFCRELRRIEEKANGRWHLLIRSTITAPTQYSIVSIHALYTYTTILLFANT
jgi:hypothetical protein